MNTRFDSYRILFWRYVVPHFGKPPTAKLISFESPCFQPQVPPLSEMTAKTTKERNNPSISVGTRRGDCFPFVDKSLSFPRTSPLKTIGSVSSQKSRRKNKLPALQKGRRLPGTHGGRLVDDLPPFQWSRLRVFPGGAF